MLSLVVAGLVGALFFAIGYAALSSGHPHEDAYILFRYVENLAAGHGIVFNPGGAPAEGATDFLWLVMLAGLVRAGLDVALAALALNALGAAVAALLLARIAQEVSDVSPWSRAALLSLPFSLLLYHGAVSSYGGFSAMLFSALCAGMVVLAWQRDERRLALLPLLGVVIALFRPEGVVIWIGFGALGLVLARSIGNARRYGMALAASVGVAFVYFTGRAAYFGLLLPLPLYVKSRGDPAAEGLAAVLPGLPGNLEWLTSGPVAIAPLLALALLVAVLWRGSSGEAKRLLLPLAPPALLFGALLTGNQTQNVDQRFQAPIFLALLLVLAQAAVLAVRRFPDRARRGAVLMLVFFALSPSLARGWERARKLTHNPWRDYADTFSPLLGSLLGERDLIALTEAGRIPFWTRARVIDVVGLNTPDTALAPLSVDDLRALEPDVVMFHHAHTMAPEALAPQTRPRPLVVAADPSTLRNAVLPRYRALAERDAGSWDEAGVTPVQLAPLVLTHFLLDEDGYDVYLVDSGRGGDYKHVYGFRRGWPHTRKAVEALERTSRQEIYHSYLELRRAGKRAGTRLAGRRAAE